MDSFIISYIWVLLLLAEDVELNPGPFNYQRHHPNLCGYRAAIFCVLNRKKMIPTRDNDGNDIFEEPIIEEGINQQLDLE